MREGGSEWGMEGRREGGRKGGVLEGKGEGWREEGREEGREGGSREDRYGCWPVTMITIDADSTFHKEIINQIPEFLY